jgi:hypothetical protein
MLGIPAAQHHVIRQERLHEQGHDRAHLPPPGFLAQPLQAAPTQNLLQAGTTRRGKLPQLQRHNHPLGNQGRTQPCPQPQEQHPSALVVPERLHRRIVDDPHGPVKGRREVEAHPPWPKVARL